MMLADTRLRFELESPLGLVTWEGEVGDGVIEGEFTQLGNTATFRLLRHGILIGWAADGANRNDTALLEPTLDAVAATGLHHDIGTLSLDRGYDFPAVRARLAARGRTDLDIQRRGAKPPPGTPHRLSLGLRWIVEATNTWWTNYGQLRRSTDRKTIHRHAALCLATAVPGTARCGPSDHASYTKFLTVPHPGLER